MGKITEKKRNKVKKLLKKDLSLRVIARGAKVSHETVRTIKKEVGDNLFDSN